MKNAQNNSNGPHNCAGCAMYEDFDGTMMCSKATYWHGGTPPNPECFEYKSELLEVVERHFRLVETLGMDHPDTLRAMMLAMEMAPKQLKDEFDVMAQAMGLMPEADGYLEDGTPVYRLEDVAERLGLSPAEAEEAMHKMLAEREALGLSNAGIVPDPELIHWKQ
jgi:hypothetical protein